MEVELPDLYPEQHAAFFNPARYSICEASTKAGKTLGAIVWEAYQLLHDHRSGHWWWVAPVHAQANIAYTRAKALFRGVWVKANDSDQRLEFPGDKHWWFKSGEKPDNLYGEDVMAAVLDEFTRLREEAWWAVRSTLTATNGPIRLIGNVKGRGNWGYRLARKAEGGAANHSYHKITAREAVAGGAYSQAELDDAAESLPEHVFRELYFCEPSDDGGNPFGISAIEACLGPLSADEPVAYGVDLAKSIDYTVFIGLDAEGRVCRFGRWHKRSWRETAQLLIEEIGETPALVDATGVGDPVVEMLEVECPLVEGVKFTSSPTSKQMWMEGLAVAIQRGFVTFPDGPIRTELETFEYELSPSGRVRYSAPEGLHDDCVCGLALAVECKRRMVAPMGHMIRHGLRKPQEYVEVDFNKLREDIDWGFKEMGQRVRQRNSVRGLM